MLCDLGLKLAVALGALGFLQTVSGTKNATLESRAPTGSNVVIIQMFEWTWDSIAAECTDFIGPAGYGFVQVSPAQEHITGTQWWTDYQPVSYTLTSKRGNRAQYQNMINTCHAAGVRVIADTIFNHMTGMDSGTGTAGSSFTHYNYPGIYQIQDFHMCGSPGNDIDDFNNEEQVWDCELVNLADLATETTYVRGRLAEYANDLISLGVDGLRLDAAKDIPPQDIAAILAQFTKALYITQEVIFGDGQPVTPALYTGNGDVMEFRYTTALQSAFLGGGISSLQDLDNRGWVAGTGANVFVADHDTERNGGSLNANSPSNTYTLAHVFSLAHPYGTPTVLSSYTGFTNTDLGAPNGGVGTCSGSTGTNGWLCQHRWTPIAGMVGFRNNVGSAAITNFVAPSSQQIAFGRGALGFVAINNIDSAWTATFQTSLPAGNYCDVTTGTASNGACSGVSVTVSSTGTFSATIPARSALGIHTGALGTGSSSGGGGGTTPPASGAVSVLFSEIAQTTFGENIFVVGSISQLGTWDPASSIPLSSANFPDWEVTVSLPANTAFQYKYIRKETDGSVVWESDPNRSATTPSSGSSTLDDTWR